MLNQSVEPKECGVDRYGQILGIVVLDGTDINLEMLKMGFTEVCRGKPVKTDLKQIHDYIAMDSRHYAKKVAQTLVEKTDDLIFFPKAVGLFLSLVMPA